jgi:hypothetical protein
MTEEEFDSLLPMRPFRREDALQAEAEAGRCTTLGLALWGRTPADLQRQLDAPYPEIPSGFELADLRRLERYLQKLRTAVGNPRNTWLSTLTLFSLPLIAGAQHITALEARSEIVRRAIDYLEQR